MSHLRNFWEPFLKQNVIYNVKQEKESIIGGRANRKICPSGSHFCHHSASLVMPKGDPWEGFFYPTLTLMMDSFNFYAGVKFRESKTFVKWPNHYAVYKCR